MILNLKILTYLIERKQLDFFDFSNPFCKFADQRNMGSKVMV